MSNEFLDEFSKEEKFKIICNALLVTLMITFIIVNVVSIGRHKEQQAKVLLQREAAAITKHMTVFPDYKQSKIYKENQMASIPKISLDEVQAGGASIELTQTLAIDDHYSVHQGDCDGLEDGYDWVMNTEGEDFVWSIIKNGQVIASHGDYRNPDNENGWGIDFSDIPSVYPPTFISSDGRCLVIYENTDTTLKIIIPATATPGTYSIGLSDGAALMGFDPEMQFKITPPCPTVKLTVTRKK